MYTLLSIVFCILYTECRTDTASFIFCNLECAVEWRAHCLLHILYCVLCAVCCMLLLPCTVVLSCSLARTRGHKMRCRVLGGLCYPCVLRCPVHSVLGGLCYPCVLRCPVHSVVGCLCYPCVLRCPVHSVVGCLCYPCVLCCPVHCGVCVCRALLLDLATIMCDAERIGRLGRADLRGPHCGWPVWLHCHLAATHSGQSP